MPEPEPRGPILLAIAREAIEHEVAPDSAPVWAEPWLRLPAATFVTLRASGELRGCIGSIRARRALGDDVADNARAAAYRDPRFSPVRPEERAFLEVEVSVLSAMMRLTVASEAEALVQIRPGIDGVYLEFESCGATFLPQVWENLPDPRDFLGELRRKAGLPARFWHPSLRLSRYTVEKYR